MGWSITPSQSGSRRLSPFTPIAGLYLAGQWTQPGPGMAWVMASGLRAARLILDVSTDDPLLPIGLEHHRKPGTSRDTSE